MSGPPPPPPPPTPPVRAPGTCPPGGPGRGALLSSIGGFNAGKLKKTQTRDSSQPSRSGSIASSPTPCSSNGRQVGSGPSPRAPVPTGFDPSSILNVRLKKAGGAREERRQSQHSPPVDFRKGLRSTPRTKINGSVTEKPSTPELAVRLKPTSASASTARSPRSPSLAPTTSTARSPRSPSHGLAPTTSTARSPRSPSHPAASTPSPPRVPALTRPKRTKSTADWDELEHLLDGMTPRGLPSTPTQPVVPKEVSSAHKPDLQSGPTGSTGRYKSERRQGHPLSSLPSTGGQQSPLPHVPANVATPTLPREKKHGENVSAFEETLDFYIDEHDHSTNREYIRDERFPKDVPVCSTTSDNEPSVRSRLPEPSGVTVVDLSPERHQQSITPVQKTEKKSEKLEEIEERIEEVKEEENEGKEETDEERWRRQEDEYEVMKREHEIERAHMLGLPVPVFDSPTLSPSSPTTTTTTTATATEAVTVAARATPSPTISSEPRHTLSASPLPNPSPPHSPILLPSVHDIHTPSVDSSSTSSAHLSSTPIPSSTPNVEAAAEISIAYDFSQALRDLLVAVRRTIPLVESAAARSFHFMGDSTSDESHDHIGDELTRAVLDAKSLCPSVYHASFDQQLDLFRGSISFAVNGHGTEAARLCVKNILIIGKAASTYSGVPALSLPCLLDPVVDVTNNDQVKSLSDAGADASFFAASSNRESVFTPPPSATTREIATLIRDACEPRVLDYIDLLVAKRQIEGLVASSGRDDLRPLVTLIEECRSDPSLEKRQRLRDAATSLLG